MWFMIIWLAVMELLVGQYVFKAWVKPAIVRRANWPFEPGPDAAVGWREMMRRSVWRYDSWTDRIMSLIGFLLVNAFIVLAIVYR